MALKDSDIREHNNPNNALVDSEFVRGGARVVNTLSEMYALASINTSLGVSKQDQLKPHVTTIKVLNTDTTNIPKKYELIDNTDTTGTGVNKVFNSTAFVEFFFGAGSSIGIPTLIEVADGRNNTVLGDIAISGNIYTAKAANDNVYSGTTLQLNDEFSATPTKSVRFQLGNDGDLLLLTYNNTSDLWVIKQRIKNATNDTHFLGTVSGADAINNNDYLTKFQGNSYYEPAFTKNSGFNLNATSSATPNTLMLRDGNGDVAARYFTTQANILTSGLTYFAGNNGDGNGTIQFFNINSIKTTLGLGDNAYTSTAYLPLAGGTLTGVLNGTSANFRGDIAIIGNLYMAKAANDDIFLGNTIQLNSEEGLNPTRSIRYQLGTDGDILLSTYNNIDDTWRVRQRIKNISGNSEFSGDGAFTGLVSERGNRIIKLVGSRSMVERLSGVALFRITFPTNTNTNYSASIIIKTHAVTGGIGWIIAQTVLTSYGVYYSGSVTGGLVNMGISGGTAGQITSQVVSNQDLYFYGSTGDNGTNTNWTLYFTIEIIQSLGDLGTPYLTIL